MDTPSPTKPVLPLPPSPSRSPSHLTPASARVNDLPNTPTSPSLALEDAPPEQRVSYYVQACDEMLSSVLSKESFLFDADEVGALERFVKLAYEARYLFIRLYLRKHQWLRVQGLKYQRDVEDLEGTVRTLTRREGEVDEQPPLANAEAEVEAKAVASTSAQDWGLIDLTASDDEEQDMKMDPIDLTLTDSEDETKPLPAPKKERSPSPARAARVALEKAPPAPPDYSRLALGQADFLKSEPEEILAMLSLEEVVSLGKRLKVDPGRGKNSRQDWIAALLKTSNQSTLFFAPSPKSTSTFTGKVQAKGKGKAPPKPPRAVLSVAKTSQSILVAREALALIGQCILLSPDWIKLFNRVSLVYHRTGYSATSDRTPSAFTASLLARFGKRHYPAYTVSRSFSIFPSRQALLDFEEALRIENELEEILVDTWAVAVPSSRTAKSGPKSKASFSTKEMRERELEQVRRPRWREGVQLFEEVWDKWKALCEVVKKEEAEGEVKTELVYFRRRFDQGWPLTRIVYKASAIFARLDDHDREVEILGALLAQTSFRRGKRGAWYDRLALVLARYPSSSELALASEADPATRAALKVARLEEALSVCFTALEDPLTHLVYRSALERRVKRLESLLKVPITERTVFPGLEKPTERIIVGERLDEDTPYKVMGRHSVWRGTTSEEDKAQVGVEELALEHYAQEGWKGYHAEGGIVTTLWGLLMWDVLFMDVDGAFETAYQSEPLDLRTDGFAVVRREAIEARLLEIERGKAAEIIREVDEREREKKTFAVGVRWDTFPLEDLLEIADCLGVRGLVLVCRMLCEEYGHRTGGLPDLCLWKAETKEILFSEVKGPGDTLSETQRVWIDVLLAAEVRVEVARVMTPEGRERAREIEKAKMIRGKLGRGKKRKKGKEEESEEEEGEVDEGVIELDGDDDD